MRPTAERRNDHLALAIQRVANSLAHLRIGVGPRRVLAAAVGAFHLQIIHVLHRLRIAQDVIVAAADVAAEQITKLAPFSRDIEHHLRRAQDVAGIAKVTVTPSITGNGRS